MKILILSREFEHSNNACGICLYNLADEFCKRGDEVHVISLVPTLQSFIYDERLEVVEILEDSFTTRCNNIKYEKSKLKIMIFRLYQIIRYVWAFFLYQLRDGSLELRDGSLELPAAYCIPIKTTLEEPLRNSNNIHI